MKLRTIALSATLALAVSGCATAPVTSSASTTSAASSRDLQIDALVLTIQRRVPGTTRASAIDLAKTACNAIDEAGSITEFIAQVATDPEIDLKMSGDMAYVVGVAVPIYCPEYRAEMDRIAGE
jgi:hypothetical protein